MVAYTTTYSFAKPTVGDDEDVWGGYLNGNFDTLESLLKGTTALTAISVTGNITVGGTVDGRDVAADGTKLDGIESGATADQTKADIDALGIAASTASTLATARNIALSGDVSGSANFDGSANISITATVADDSHNHVISNVDGLQTALDGKLSTSGKAADSNLLDGIDSGSFLRSDANDTASGIITLSSTARDALNFSGNATDDNRGVAFNGRAALTADYNDGYLRINNASEFSNGVFTPGVMRADGGFNVNGATVWNSSNDGSGSGLDADTLDGVQGSSYLRSDTSDTFNGTLYVTGIIEGQGDVAIGGGSGYGYLKGYSTNWNHFVGSRMQVSGSTASPTISGGHDCTFVEYLDTDSSGFKFKNSHSGSYVDVAQITRNGIFISDGSLREDYDALSGTSPTCNVNNGGAFSVSMSGNTTFTFTSPTSGYSTGFILQLTGNGSTVTWPSSVDWAGGTAPDAPASGETDIYVFWTRNGGSTWYGVQSIDAAA